jgi:exodeoxyribonuclease VII small subunit
MAERTFEQMLADLEEHTRRLEAGGLPLNDALDLYERGISLARALREVLDQAELRVEQLSSALDVDDPPEEEAVWDDDDEDGEEEEDWPPRSP